MRAGGVLYYLHDDHLGSTSLTTDASGAVVAAQRYLVGAPPCGEVRLVLEQRERVGQRDGEQWIWVHWGTVYPLQ